jgi:AcrR family transcriptional regulator
MKKNKENPASLRSKEYIVKSLLKLMDEKPFSKISIKEITDKAQLARMTFYSNFKSKEDVLVYHTDNLLASFFKEIEKSHDITIKSLYITYFNFWKRHNHYVNLLRENNILIFVKLFENYIYQLNDRYQLLDLGLNDHEQGYISYKVTYFSGGLCNVLSRWVKTGMKEEPESIVAMLLGNSKLN